VPGWTGDHEWTGFVPFDALPRVFDPPSHTIVTANHRPNPHRDPLHLSLEYPEPYRAKQIRALLEARPKLTPDDFRLIQSDTHSRHAEALLPLLLAAVQPTEPRDRLAVEILREWHFDAAGTSAAAAIFEAWFLHLAPAIVGDDLGPRLLAGYQGRYSFVTRFVTSLLAAGDHSHWCDDAATTAATENCSQAVTLALHRAVASLAATLGNDLRSWKWRDVHPVVFPHQGLDAVAALRPILNRSVPGGGDWSTVNVGAVDADRPYEQREIPGYRQIVDLSPDNDSRFLDAVGQSGHLLSPGYDNFLEFFTAVDHRPMRMVGGAIAVGALGTLRLRPPRE
jgi:penicillin amidase